MSAGAHDLMATVLVEHLTVSHFYICHLEVKLRFRQMLVFFNAFQLSICHITARFLFLLLFIFQQEHI